MSISETKSFIVRSGCGYFVRFVEDTNEMVSDEESATRMTSKEAEEVSGKLGSIGICSVISFVGIIK
jgi:hypothetical protein